MRIIETLHPPIYTHSLWWCLCLGPENTKLMRSTLGAIVSVQVKWEGKKETSQSAKLRIHLRNCIFVHAAMTAGKEHWIHQHLDINPSCSKKTLVRWLYSAVLSRLWPLTEILPIHLIGITIPESLTESARRKLKRKRSFFSILLYSHTNNKHTNAARLILLGGGSAKKKSFNKTKHFIRV